MRLIRKIDTVKGRISYLDSRIYVRKTVQIKVQGDEKRKGLNKFQRTKYVKNN